MLKRGRRSGEPLGTILTRQFLPQGKYFLAARFPMSEATSATDVASR